ncbi:hypothetical protein [uncultured Ruegeria sp.]|nr:hypothetical protein [uncultured Ruegeria sp.]
MNWDNVIQIVMDTAGDYPSVQLQVLMRQLEWPRYQSPNPNNLISTRQGF